MSASLTSGASVISSASSRNLQQARSLGLLAYGLSIAFSLIGLVVLLIRGVNYSVEFTGGPLVQIETTQPACSASKFARTAAISARTLAASAGFSSAVAQVTLSSVSRLMLRLVRLAEPTLSNSSSTISSLEWMKVAGAPGSVELWWLFNNRKR